MKTERELRREGMQTLIQALGLVDAERFIASVFRDRSDHTEWRRHGLPRLSPEEPAHQANACAKTLR